MCNTYPPGFTLPGLIHYRVPLAQAYPLSSEREEVIDAGKEELNVASSAGSLFRESENGDDGKDPNEGNEVAVDSDISKHSDLWTANDEAVPDVELKLEVEPAWPAASSASIQPVAEPEPAVPESEPERELAKPVKAVQDKKQLAPDNNEEPVKKPKRVSKRANDHGEGKIQCAYVKLAKGTKAAERCKNSFWPKGDGNLYCHIQTHRAPEGRRKLNLL